MRLLGLLLGALLFSNVSLATTRWKTDELTNTDGGPIAFPGGIIVPTSPQAPVSDATFYSSATYSATLTAGTNADAVTTPVTLKYDRAGKYVHVWGQVAIDPQAVSSALTSFFVSLPVPPAVFTTAARLSGTAGIPATAAQGTCAGSIQSGLNRTAKCTYGAVTAGGDLVNINFIYALE